MNIFDFYISEGSVDFPKESELLKHVSMIPKDVQKVLYEMAKKGSYVGKMSREKKEGISQWIGSHPLILRTELGFKAYPIYASIETRGEVLEVRPSNEGNFHEKMVKLLESHDLKVVRFNHERSAAIFSDWVLRGYNYRRRTTLSELRSLLKVERKNHPSFTHMNRLIETIEKEFNREGYSICLKSEKESKYTRSVLLEIQEIPSDGKLG